MNKERASRIKRLFLHNVSTRSSGAFKIAAHLQQDLFLLTQFVESATGTFFEEAFLFVELALRFEEAQGRVIAFGVESTQFSFANVERG